LGYQGRIGGIFQSRIISGIPMDESIIDLTKKLTDQFEKFPKACKKDS
jgi:hypothetical protein